MRIKYIVIPLLLVAKLGFAEVTRIEIDERKPFAGGAEFGNTGTYESISGKLFFAVNPENPHNSRITDLEFAPQNDNGRVEFWADFFLLQPINPAKGNGTLLYDVHNRGNKLAFWIFNEGERTNDPSTLDHAGNSFLMREGYSILWTGWNGDVVEDGNNRLIAGIPVARKADGKPITGKSYVEILVDEKTFSQPFFGSPWGTPKAYPSISLDTEGALLTKRPSRSEPAEKIPHDQWAFAEFKESKVLPSPTSLYLNDGFRPGWIYELVYTARDPRVSGLGLAGLRDAVSFFKYGGAGNPAMGSIDHALVFGISQSGRLIHHFFYEGLNEDESGKVIFDGAISHVPGAGKGLFNYRFGMATVYGTYRGGNLSPADFFPFSPSVQTDTATGARGDSFARLRELESPVPKVFFVQTSTEYWSRGASLLHTDVDGTKDIDLDPTVRIYSIAGAQHLGGGPTTKGICQYPRSPLRHRGPVLRALLVAMNSWVKQAADPPASRYPRIGDGTLVNLDTFRDQFPKVPGVKLPEANYCPLRLDPGPRWQSEGIADHVPPKVGKPYPALVPAVDSDGNELAGIRLPDVAVPLATYIGWNLRDEEFGAGGMLAGLHGGYLEFPFMKDPADPRISILERYPNKASYLARYAEAVLDLREQGFLLDEDAVRLLNEARERDFWEGEKSGRDSRKRSQVD